MAGNEGWSREFMFRAGINPLRFAVRASRKPRAAVLGRPLDACVSPLGPAGKPSLVCTPRPMNSRDHPAKND